MTGRDMWAMEPSALEAYLAFRERVELRGAFGDLREVEPEDDQDYEVIDGVAIVPVAGQLEVSLGLMGWLFGGTSYSAISEMVADADSDPRVESLRLVIDSPGGDVDGMLETARVIAAAEKPVEARIVGSGCSAAYVLASAADVISAAPTARVGCLGASYSVRMPDDSRRVFVSSSTPRKNAAPDSKAGAEDAQQLVDDIAELLLDAVAEYRGLDGAEAVAEKYGRGRVVIASRAKSAGMIDEIVVDGETIDDGAQSDPAETDDEPAASRGGGAMAQRKSAGGEVTISCDEHERLLAAAAAAEEFAAGDAAAKEQLAQLVEQVGQLNARLEAADAARLEAEAAASNVEAEAELDRLTASGHLLPHERQAAKDAWLAERSGGPAVFTAVFRGRTKHAPVGPPTQRATAAPDPNRGDLDSAIRARMATDKISYEEALGRVRRENPALVRAHYEVL